MTVKTKLRAGRVGLGKSLYENYKALPVSSRLNNEQLEVIYAMAYSHVIQRQYQQALPIFAILATYGATRSHYLAGLALCLEKCQRYEEAIAIYSLLIIMHPGGLEPAIQIVECLLMLGKTTEAIEELDRILEHIELTHEGEYIKPRAILLKELSLKAQQ